MAESRNGEVLLIPAVGTGGAWSVPGVEFPAHSELCGSPAVSSFSESRNCGVAAGVEQDRAG